MFEVDNLTRGYGPPCTLLALSLRFCPQCLRRGPSALSQAVPEPLRHWLQRDKISTGQSAALPQRRSKSFPFMGKILPLHRPSQQRALFPKNLPGVPTCDSERVTPPKHYLHISSQWDPQRSRPRCPSGQRSQTKKRSRSATYVNSQGCACNEKLTAGFIFSRLSISTPKLSPMSHPPTSPVSTPARTIPGISKSSAKASA